jgi:hypothetical protein
MSNSICGQGVACTQGAPDCSNGAVGGACLTCQCDPTAGMYKCSPCAGAADGGVASGGNHDAGGTGTMPPGCMPGLACNVGASCGNGVQGAGCYSCQCGAGGTYQCASCGGGMAADGGAPAGGGGTGGSSGTGMASPQCMNGLACPQPGLTCIGPMLNGSCQNCTCAQGGTLVCQWGPCQ